MEDKAFEILIKMYSEMMEQLKGINGKLDKKADKSDIVRLENELSPKVEALFDGYNQHTDAPNTPLNQEQGTPVDGVPYLCYTFSSTSIFSILLFLSTGSICSWMKSITCSGALPT